MVAGMSRKSLPCLLIASGLALSLAAAPAQAQIAPLAVTFPSAMPLAAVGSARLACLKAASPGAALAGAPQMAAPVMSKSAAILGGQPSALEAMRLQQAGMVQPAAPVALAPGAAILPATASLLPLALAGLTCPPAPFGPAPSAAEPFARPASGAYLGTERVEIGRSRFDAEWKRVSDNGLSQRDLTGALGHIPEGRVELLERVNRWVNHAIAYRGDGKRDSWADARSTLRRRAGDCEDYAILKMQLLAAAGVARDDMMLTLARDTLRRVDHAVLLVRDGGTWVMLDMQSDRITSASDSFGYNPVISFAGNSRYLHGKRYQPPAQPLRVALAD